MINRKNLKYCISGISATIFCVTGVIFSYLEVNTTLGILPPPYDIVYTPAYVTGTYTSGPIYIEIIGSGIKPNITGIYDNGIYIFGSYRGTGPFTTGAGYSSGNTRTYIQTTKTIDRIDSILPTFAGVADGATYDIPVIITFSDNHPGVMATINGNPFTNGNSLNTNGTYQLIVTDTAGNSTGATFIVYLTQTPSGGGGGGGAALGVRSMIKKKCETRSCYSYYYDDLCGPCSPKLEEGITIPVPGYRPVYRYINPTSPNIKDSDYPKEWNDAYLRAYHLGITTVSNIKDADMKGVLYRKFAAKMASEFAIKIVGLTPDESKTCTFKDIEKEIPELQYYMRLACKLGIMGLNYYGEPDNIFNPNYVVTRDQLVAILSRILFRDTFNLKPQEYSFFDKVKNFAVHTINSMSNALGLNITIHTPLDWYTKHLEAIKKLGIITDYTITMKEFRGYVMIIMYRMDKLGIKTIQKLIQ